MFSSMLSSDLRFRVGVNDRNKDPKLCRGGRDFSVSSRWMWKESVWSHWADPLWAPDFLFQTEAHWMPDSCYTVTHLQLWQLSSTSLTNPMTSRFPVNLITVLFTSDASDDCVLLLWYKTASLSSCLVSSCPSVHIRVYCYIKYYR